MSNSTIIPEEIQIALLEHRTNQLGDFDSLQFRLKDIKRIRDDLQARKDLIIKPLKEGLDQAKALFAPFEDSVKEADMRVRSALLEIEVTREKEQALLAKQIEKGKVSVDEAMTLVVNAPKGLFRTVQRLEIKKKSLVPDKYWILDEVLLRKDLLAGKKIPGVSLVEEKTVVSR